MTRKGGSLSWAMAAALLLAGAAFHRARSEALMQAAAQGRAEPVTVLVTFGTGATSDQRWDGSVEVRGGQLVRLEPWHFSPADSISGTDSWKCTNRRDEMRGFPLFNYYEITANAAPPTLFFPVGVYVTIRPAPDARAVLKTTQGVIEFRLDEIDDRPKSFLEGRATVARTATVEKLSTPDYEDDEPAAAALPDGSVAVAWVAYRDRGDRVLMRTHNNGSWSAPEEVTPRAGDFFRCSLASDGTGGLWAFWSEREGTRWTIWGRLRRDGRWQQPVRVSEAGSNFFHRSAASADGTVFVVWQSFRGDPPASRSDIFLRTWSRGSWSAEMRVSTSPANDWEPAVAGGPGGSAYIAWDSYDKGNYDVWFRPFESGKLGRAEAVTSSPRFQAHASVAVDPRGRPWLAWDESGTNWGKDQGFLIVPAIATPLHQERRIRIALRDGDRWLEPKAKLEEFYTYRLFPNFENPHIVFDGAGALTIVFRHWTRQVYYAIGSPMFWENWVTRFDGERWSTPVPLASSTGSIEKRPALARDARGEIRVAWMSDDRRLGGRPGAEGPGLTLPGAVPRNAEIYAASLGPARAASFASSQFEPFAEPFAEEVPLHADEAKDVAAIRSYTVAAGNRRYRIYRGDMHRHTDVSQDFKYDGSLIEVYRYALDAAAFDYIVPTDHQLGYDQEFTWWQDEKLKDLFHVPGTFTPLFGYERSVPYPNGHRNVIFAERGVRTLPIPPEEQQGKVGAAKLYEYLRRNRGISMPHSTATNQGTDWRDNDAELEPLMEIFQGYRNNYEYPDAPRAASATRLQQQRSGYQEAGFWWNALAKGYKLGVQASSDHWSTHISYACIVAESFTRPALFDALKRRHAYAATDNIVLDFRAEAAGTVSIMGDVVRSQTAPVLDVRAIGTTKIAQIVIVKNQKFVYTGRPNTEDVRVRFVDRDFTPGKNYYYVRVLQTDGQLAWSSPIWVE